MNTDFWPYLAAFTAAQQSEKVPPLKLFQRMMEDGGHSAVLKMVGCEVYERDGRNPIGIFSIPKELFNLDEITDELRRISFEVTQPLYGFSFWSIRKHDAELFYGTRGSKKYPRWIAIYPSKGEYFFYDSMKGGELKTFPDKKKFSQDFKILVELTRV